MTHSAANEVTAHLSTGATSLVLIDGGGMPVLAHFGPALGNGPIDPAIFERPVVGGGLDLDTPVGIVAESAAGWFGRPGIEGSRPDGSDFAPRFTLTSSQLDGNLLIAALRDDQARLGLSISVELTESEVAVLWAEIENLGSDRYNLGALRLSVPVAAAAQEVLTLGGRHTFEFAQHRTPWNQNSIAVENRHGKTSHERLGAIFVGTKSFSEQRGEVWGLHIGWSGNYELVADGVTDGRKVLQVGELLLPGEIGLEPGETYRTPAVYLSYSANGLNEVSRQFHNHLRARPNHPKLPRPIHLNTWEAVYFDHNVKKLRALADAAAAVGIERFVLDDGWFGGRRDDTRGLGDWWVSPDVWPDGLTPLIDHVRSLGMDFGIWVEPEMVNPDSDLYREHPDWALVDQRYPHVLGRNQLVLDISKPEVEQHIFDRLDALLRDHDISYLKWDHNRDLVSPASSGHAGVHRQTLALYRLIDRIKTAHPRVDIETCASGGGRVDFGILERTDRVWTSDSIDALDRHSIQRGFSLLFPPELMGTHIGATVAHTTGRRHRLGFRGLAAFFGSMGVEWNILEAAPTELDQLTRLIDLHKRYRTLLHSGDVLRLDHPDATVEIAGVVARDRSEALIAITRLVSAPSHHTGPVRIPGLEADQGYTVRHVAETGERLGYSRKELSWLNSKLSMTGRQLAAAGFSIPPLDPESSMLIRIASEE